VAKFGESNDLIKCSFCAKGQKQVKKLIAGPACTSATSASTCATTSSPNSDRPSLSSTTSDAARDLSLLDEFVIGQVEAKKILAVAVYNHYKRIQTAAARRRVEVAKSNVLLSADRCGKTFLARRWPDAQRALRHRRPPALTEAVTSARTSKTFSEAPVARTST